MIKELIKLANHLDSKGFVKEADYLDGIIKQSSTFKLDIDSKAGKKIIETLKSAIRAEHGPNSYVGFKAEQYDGSIELSSDGKTLTLTPTEIGTQSYADFFTANHFRDEKGVLRRDGDLNDKAELSDYETLLSSSFYVNAIPEINNYFGIDISSGKIISTPRPPSLGLPDGEPAVTIEYKSNTSMKDAIMGSEGEPEWVRHRAYRPLNEDS